MYDLLDFGEGRKLERFGRRVLDRPCPAAENVAKSAPQRWSEADARYERIGNGKGVWSPGDSEKHRWTISHGPMMLELKLTPFGHVGCFPEQMVNWDWIGRRLAACDSPRVLNLFAYTGGGTLAAAAAGAQVTHVDSAKNVVAWARRNAELSGMADAPIRWLVEDAMKFGRRQMQRGNRYDAVILDPPSYGHGPSGQVFRAVKHLPPLLRACGTLCEQRPKLVLLTCHTPGLTAEKLADMVARWVLGDERKRVERGTMYLTDAAGRKLPSGVFARWAGDEQ